MTNIQELRVPIPDRRYRRLESLNPERLARNLILHNPGLEELEHVAMLAKRDQPNLADIEEVKRVFVHNPDCFFVISRRSENIGSMKKPEGFFAFLPLNESGFDALFSNKLNARSPQIEFVAKQAEFVTAIYIWYIYAPGTLSAAIALWIERLQLPKYRGKPLLARAIVPERGKFFESMGFCKGVWWNGRFNEDLYSYHPSAIAEEQNSTQLDRSAPIFDGGPSEKLDRGSATLSVRVARTLDDIHKVFAIRAATYINEQECFFDEEFDGNDFCATHLLGFVDGEPAGCLRIRFFGDFAKGERLAVRHEFRRTRIGFKLVRAMIELCRMKNFRRIYGHSRTDLVNFWGLFGFKEIPGRRPFKFSDYDYCEVALDLEPHPGAVRMDSDPYAILRPEGSWHRPGILEASAARTGTDPERAQRLAHALRHDRRRHPKPAAPASRDKTAAPKAGERKSAALVPG